MEQLLINEIQGCKKDILGSKNAISALHALLTHRATGPRVVHDETLCLCSPQFEGDTSGHM